jgi:hypothetical protein
MRKFYTKTLFVLITMLLVLSVIGTISASEKITPATTLNNRGVGIQIRPANQMNLPLTGNGGYTPFQGSSYTNFP